MIHCLRVNLSFINYHGGSYTDAIIPNNPGESFDSEMAGYRVDVVGY